MAKVIDNILILDSGGELEMWQVQNIISGNAGNVATDEEIKEYLTNEGWQDDQIAEFIEAVAKLEITEETMFLPVVNNS